MLFNLLLEQICRVSAVFYGPWEVSLSMSFRCAWILGQDCDVSLCVSEPLTTVRNLRVYDPSTSTLSVRWDHAEGNPRKYKLFYAPVASGAEELVIISGSKHY